MLYSSSGGKMRDDKKNWAVMDLPITVMRHKTFEGGNTSPFYCSVKGRETRRSLLGIFHVVGDSFHPTGTWSSHNKKWRSFRCRSGGYIIFLCLSPSLSSVNSEDWQLLISLRKISQVAFCRSSGFFFCRNSRRFARCTCCELEQLRSDSAGKSSDHQRLGP